MNYAISLKPSARRELDALPGKDYLIIEKAISALEKNPRPLKVKKLADSGLAAELEDCELWTADERLINSLGGKSKRLRWL